MRVSIIMITKIVLVLFTFNSVAARELGSKCKEDLDWINSLVMERVEEDEFSVEPVLGVGLPAKPRFDTTLEQLIKMITEQNDTISHWRIRECLGRYLKGSRPWNSDLKEGYGDAGLLGYEKPHYLGPIEPFPIPVPDDEDYRPGPEGYTTYINPYNFMDKVPEYKPRPQPTGDEDDYFQGSSEETSTTSTPKPSPDEPEGPDDISTTTSTTTDKPSSGSEEDYYDSSYDDYY